MSSDSRRISPLLWAALALVGVALLNIGAPFLPVPNQIIKGALGVVFVPIYIALVVGFALGIARTEMSVAATIAIFEGFIIAWLLVEYAARPATFSLLRPFLAVQQDPTIGLKLLLLSVNALQTVALIGGATFFGVLVSRLIRYPSLVGPIGALVALVDIWGVLFGGIVAQLMTNPVTAPISERALAQGPSIGAVAASAPQFVVSLPSIGIGDFLFFGMFLAALVRFEMNWRASAWLMGLFVTLTLWLFFAPLPIPALPGLLPIGLGVVLPNLKHFKYTRDEKFALLWAAILVFFLTIALYFGFRAALPKVPSEPANSAQNAPSPAQFSVSSVAFVPTREGLSEFPVSREIVEAQSRATGNRTALLNEVIRLAPDYFPPRARVLNVSHEFEGRSDFFRVNLNREFADSAFWRRSKDENSRLAFHALARNVAFINEPKGAPLPVEFVVEGRKPNRSDFGAFNASQPLNPNQIWGVNAPRTQQIRAPR